MIAGPARRGDMSRLTPACRGHMLVMYRGRQRLGEDVGHVVVGVDLACLDMPVSDVLSHLQVAPVD
eukprot:3745170-Pleurochrysis_carterae.AAC.1